MVLSVNFEYLESLIADWSAGIGLMRHPTWPEIRRQESAKRPWMSMSGSPVLNTPGNRWITCMKSQISSMRLISLDQCARLIAVIIFLCGTHPSTEAQVIKRVSVFSEGEDAENRQCNVSNQSVVAAAESALRYNRINVTSAPDEEILVYINTTLLSLDGDRRCVMSQGVQFMKWGLIRVDQSNSVLTGWHELCLRNKVGIHFRNNLQGKLNENVREMIDLCISRIESKATR